MLEKKHQTELGAMHYWINKIVDSSMPTVEEIERELEEYDD